jgi:hypothetical protein
MKVPLFPILLIEIGFSSLHSSWIPRSSLRLISDEKDMAPSEWAQYKRLWRNGPRGLEENWKDFIEFTEARASLSKDSTGVVWAGENHGCPCRLRQKTAGDIRRESVGVGRHPERPERLQRIMEAWQKQTYNLLIQRNLTRDFYAMSIGYQVVTSRNWN